MVTINDKEKFNRNEVIYARLNEDEFEQLEFIRKTINFRDNSKTIRLLIAEKYSMLVNGSIKDNANTYNKNIVAVNNDELEMLIFMKNFLNENSVQSTISLLVGKTYESIKLRIKKETESSQNNENIEDNMVNIKAYQEYLAYREYKDYESEIERFIYTERDEITEPNEIRKIIKGNTRRILEYIFSNRIEGRFIGKTSEIGNAVNLKDKSVTSNLRKLEKHKLIIRKINISNLQTNPRREIFITEKAILIFNLKIE